MLSYIVNVLCSAMWQRGALYYIMFHYVVVCCPLLCYVAVCCPMLYCDALSCGMLSHVVLCCTELRYVVLFWAMLRYVVLCCAILCYVAVCCPKLRFVVLLCYVVLDCAMLYYVVLSFGGLLQLYFREFAVCPTVRNLCDLQGIHVIYLNSLAFAATTELIQFHLRCSDLIFSKLQHQSSRK